MKLRFRVCYYESAFNFKANVMNKKKTQFEETDWKGRLSHWIISYLYIRLEYFEAISKRKELIDRAGLSRRKFNQRKPKGSLYNYPIFDWWNTLEADSPRLRFRFRKNCSPFSRTCFNFHTCHACGRHAQLA